MTQHCTHDERLLDYLYEEMSAPDAEAYSAHVEGCEHCRHELAELRRVRTAFHDLPVPEPSAEALQRMTAQLLHQAAQDKKRMPGGAGAGDAEDGQGREGLLGKLLPFRRPQLKKALLHPATGLVMAAAATLTFVVTTRDNERGPGLVAPQPHLEAPLQSQSQPAAVAQKAAPPQAAQQQDPQAGEKADEVAAKEDFGGLSKAARGPARQAKPAVSTDGYRLIDKSKDMTQLQRVTTENTKKAPPAPVQAADDRAAAPADSAPSLGTRSDGRYHAEREAPEKVAAAPKTPQRGGWAPQPAAPPPVVTSVATPEARPPAKEESAPAQAARGPARAQQAPAPMQQAPAQAQPTPEMPVQQRAQEPLAPGAVAGGPAAGAPSGSLALNERVSPMNAPPSGSVPRGSVANSYNSSGSARPDQNQGPYQNQRAAGGKYAPAKGKGNSFVDQDIQEGKAIQQAAVDTQRQRDINNALGKGDAVNVRGGTQQSDVGTLMAQYKHYLKSHQCKLAEETLRELENRFPRSPDLDLNLYQKVCGVPNTNIARPPAPMEQQRKMAKPSPKSRRSLDKSEQYDELQAPAPAQQAPAEPAADSKK